MHCDLPIRGYEVIEPEKFSVVLPRKINGVSKLKISLYAFYTLFFVVLCVLQTACVTNPARSPDNSPQPVMAKSEYLIGPGDQLQVFVWQNPELSVSVPVRPDGAISIPLVEDLPAVGKTPAVLGRDIEERLTRYIRNPKVTVIVTKFVGALSEQVRVIGQAMKPQALPYRENMTLLDVMIDVGGLTEYAAGNRAKLVRQYGGKKTEIRVRLEDLLKDGDVSANMKIFPGDILIIPESWF